MKLKSQLLLLQDQNFASMCGGLSRMAGGVSESKLATFANACFPTGCYSGLLLVKFILCFLKGAKAERTTLYVKGPTLAGFLGNSSLESPSRLCVRRLLAFDKHHFTHCPCLWGSSLVWDKHWNHSHFAALDHPENDRWIMSTHRIFTRINR